MSLSLSNSLSSAEIPFVKIGENGKISHFQILQLQFHHEVGLGQSRYLELFSLGIVYILIIQKISFDFDYNFQRLERNYRKNYRKPLNLHFSNHQYR